VNVDASDAGKNYRCDAVLEADAARGLRLARRRGPGARRARRARSPPARRRGEACRSLDPLGLRFLDCVSHGLPADAVVLADMCVPGYWIAGLHGFPSPRRLQYPVGWGTLGYAFPASLGAALADTGPVVSFSGDGRLPLRVRELATVAQERLPLTAVIVDDGGYGMLRHDQDVHGDERSASTSRRPTSRRWRPRSACGRDGRRPRRRLRRGARAPLADPEPSVLVSRGPALRPPPTTSPEWYRRK
jgi:acetolactate synthase-1/2/3 large subunit